MKSNLSMMFVPRIVAFFLFSSLASVGFACEHDQEPEWALKLTQHDAVVLGRVQDAAYTDIYKYDPTAWRGTVQLIRTLRGHTKSKVFEIGGSSSPGNCERSQPPPVGTVLVLYLLHEEQSDRVVYELTVDGARAFDRRLRGLLPEDE